MKTITLTRKIKMYVRIPDSITDEKLRNQYKNDVWSELRRISEMNFKFHNALVKKLMEIDACVDNTLELDTTFLQIRALYNQNKDIKINRDAYFDYKNASKKTFMSNNYGHPLVSNMLYKYIGYLNSQYPKSEQFGSYLTAPISNNVIKKYNKDIKDVENGKKSVASYSKTQPIPFYLASGKSDKSKAWFNKYNNDYAFKFKWNSSSTIELGLQFGKDKSNNRIMLDRVFNNDPDYTLSDSDVQIDGKEIFLLLKITQKINQNISLNVNSVLGVDLGVKHAAVISSVDGKMFKYIGDKQFVLMRMKMDIERNKRNVQKNLVYSTGGHGRTRKLQKLNDIKSKESNFRNTFNHKISSEIIKFAIVNGFGTINVEDLSVIPLEDKNKKLLRYWSYHDLLSKIEYKAKKFGIVFNKVNPAHTSQRCCECDKRGNRKKQDTFICACPTCKSFDKPINADVNAARNIAKLI